MSDLDQYPKHELSPRERQELRRILEGDRGWRWTKTGMRRVGLWILSVVGAMVILRDLVRDLLNRLIQ